MQEMVSKTNNEFTLLYLLYEELICWSQNTQTLITQHKPDAIVCQNTHPVTTTIKPWQNEMTAIANFKLFKNHINVSKGNKNYEFPW